MIFSERYQLELEYKQWLKKNTSEANIPIADTFANMLIFLEEKGLLKTGGKQ